MRRFLQLDEHSPALVDRDEMKEVLSDVVAVLSLDHGEEDREE